MKRKNEMMYKNFLKTVARRFEQIFSEISAEYNFDYGREFEIALCRALRTILPQRYGVCLGHVVSKDNQSAGDDIIVYNRETFPSLRLLPQDRYDRKNHIPIEAVCAYIEAKYTIYIKGTGRQSLSKALSQVSEVKSVIKLRKERHLRQYDEYASFPKEVYLTRGEEWPEIANPPYGAIVAFRVCEAERKPIIQDPVQIRDLLTDRLIDIDFAPDMAILGSSNLFLPISKKSTREHLQINSPFFVDGKTELNIWPIKEHAFAVGICSLLWAIDTIRLNPLPWSDILIEGINERGSY
jgi:hypothetical protein